MKSSAFLAVLIAACPLAAAHPPMQPEEAVQATLTAMADGNLAGESLVSYIRESKLDVRPMLDGKLPPQPRILAPQIARLGMQARLRGMPACAEKEYMIRSMMARVWIDLGGEPKGLPLLDPVVGWWDRPFSQEIKPWLDNAPQTALAKIGEDAGLKPLDDLGLPAANYEKANKEFTDFLAEESTWRRARRP